MLLAPTRTPHRMTYSDRENRSATTPPPDYETFLSDNDLPSARTRNFNNSLRERRTATIRNYVTFKVSWRLRVLTRMPLFCSGMMMAMMMTKNLLAEARLQTRRAALEELCGLPTRTITTTTTRRTPRKTPSCTVMLEAEGSEDSNSPTT